MTTKSESIASIKHDLMKSCVVGNNTFEVVYKDGTRAIRLHKTDIITFTDTQDGEVPYYDGMMLDYEGYHCEVCKRNTENVTSNQATY